MRDDTHGMLIKHPALDTAAHELAHYGNDECVPSVYLAAQDSARC